MATMVVKIGTSSLVDAAGQLRDDVLEQRVAELVRVRRQGHRPVLVTSGAIACGLGSLGITERPTALPDLQAASAVGQGVLFRRYLQAFEGHGVVPAQVLLTSADLERRASYVNARNTLERLLEMGAVPVVNENDTTATDDITFGDNDVLAAHVAISLRATWLVLLTDREGLYVRGANGEPELLGDVPAGVAPGSIDLAQMGSSGAGRGGISSKLASASMATAGGVTCVVASGSVEGVITAVAHGQHVGRITVDAGAARALAAQGTSLLPVGIAACDGAFVAGDAVDVVGADGDAVGKGIATMSADEVRQIVGMKSADARRVLPDAPEEVVHRDQFVLLAGEA
jgi:glutamate 5-kinase